LRDRSCAKTNPRDGQRDLPSRSSTPERLAGVRSSRRYRLQGLDHLSRTGLLGYESLPSLRTIERILQKEIEPRLFFARKPVRPRAIIRSHAKHSNQRHQVDLTARVTERLATAMVFPGVPRHLRSGGLCRISAKTHMEAVLAFIVRAWQRLGFRTPCRPTTAICSADLASRFAQSLSACLWWGSTDFHPRTRAMAHGSIDTQRLAADRLLTIPLHSPAQVRRDWVDDGRPASRTYHPFEFQTTLRSEGMAVRTLLTTFAAISNPCQSP